MCESSHFVNSSRIAFVLPIVVSILFHLPSLVIVNTNQCILIKYGLSIYVKKR